MCKEVTEPVGAFEGDYYTIILESYVVYTFNCASNNQVLAIISTYDIYL